jgi:hypothetical protein
MASQNWDADPLAPITPTATLAELEAKHGAAAQAVCDEANAAVAALEGVPVAPIVVEPVAPVAAILNPEEPVKRGRGRPRKSETPTLAAQLAAEGVLEDE